jgi:SET domain-containing protein
MHIIDDYGKFINHSSQPNTTIKLNNIIAIRNIEKYEEITINHDITKRTK